MVLSFFQQAPAQREACILTINGGSSSIRFAVFQRGASLNKTLSGKIDHIGQRDATLDFKDLLSHQQGKLVFQPSHGSATKFLLAWLDEQIRVPSLVAIGHRVVHGMQHTETQLITADLLDDLHQIIPCDPQHLPSEIDLIEAFAARAPNVPQFASFDTGFHATMPRVAKLLAIPRRFDRKRIQRYGFHGLSYAYQMQELKRLGDPAATNGCVILAHLGNGASLCAVHDGKSIETSMGFTPAAGLPMGNRSGDLDPGLMGYLARAEQMSPAVFDHMVNHESGLLGVSELSSDMRELTKQAAVDVRAAEAVELFCYQSKKWIGALVAALGGLQTLVFAGGIGENSPTVRQRICEGLGCLGITLDPGSNATSAPIISSADSRVTVRVIRTDEEQIIAQAVHKLLGTNYV